MSEYWRGRKHTPETLRKLSEFKKKNPVRYWQGKKRPPHTPETLEKISRGVKGYKHTAETRRQMSEARRGEKGSGWRGGVYSVNKALREGVEYKLWRESVFKRDNHTCIWCGKRGGKLNADHIKPFAFFPEIRFAIDNGRTLCEPCHRSTETFGCRTHHL